MLEYLAFFVLFNPQTAWVAPFAVDSRAERYGAYSYDDRCMNVIDVQTGKVLARLKGLSFGPYKAIFSSDGHYLAGTNTYGEIGLWDTQSGSLILKLTDADQGHMSATFYPITFSSDSTLLAIGNWMDVKRSRIGPTKGLITVWRTKDGRRVQRSPTDWYGSITNLTFLGNRRRIRFSGLEVRELELSSNKVTSLGYPRSSVDSISDNGRFAVGGFVGGVDAWDLERKVSLMHRKTPAIEGVFVSSVPILDPSGLWVAICHSHLVVNPGSDTGYTASMLEMVEVKSGKVVWSVPETYGVVFQCFSTDGKTCLLGDGEIRETRSGRQLRKPDRSQLVILGEGGIFKVAKPQPFRSSK